MVRVKSHIKIPDIEAELGHKLKQPGPKKRTLGNPLYRQCKYRDMRYIHAYTNWVFLGR